MTTPTVEQRILKALQTIAIESDGDCEADHQRADDLLCQFLLSLGYADVVDAWKHIEKWYT